MDNMEEEEIEREQQNYDLLRRRPTVTKLPVRTDPTARRSMMVFPCLYCPVSPLITDRVLNKPWMPSYESLQGSLVVFLLLSMMWGTLWAGFGPIAGPFSDVFNMMLLGVVSHLVGLVVGRFTPLLPMYGMLFVSALARNLANLHLHIKSGGLRAAYVDHTMFVSVAMFLLRAGLSMRLSMLQRYSGLVLALGFLPQFAETLAVSILATYIIPLPWQWGMLLGAATSPMSVLTVMQNAIYIRETDLRSDVGMGSVLTAISAISGAAGLCMTRIALAFAFGEESWSVVMVGGPIQLVAGIGIGIVIGYVLIYVPNDASSHTTFYRIEALTSVSLCAVAVAHMYHVPAIGFLTAFTTSCVATTGWSTLAMDINKNTLRYVVELMWQVVQPFLMSVVGIQMDFTKYREIPFGRYFSVLLMGMLVRFGVSVLCTMRSDHLLWKERLYMCVACLPKGTIQVAASVWVVEYANQRGTHSELAELIRVCSMLAVVLAGPIPAVVSSILAPKILRIIPLGLQV